MNMANGKVGKGNFYAFCICHANIIRCKSVSRALPNQSITAALSRLFLHSVVYQFHKSDFRFRFSKRDLRTRHVIVMIVV